MSMKRNSLILLGKPGNTPGSINGHQFIPPTSSILTNEEDLQSQCSKGNCSLNNICTCTYSVELKYEKVYQFVLTNLGNGRGWSHPVHLHGHYFYVMKMGFGIYNETTGKFCHQQMTLKGLVLKTTAIPLGGQTETGQLLYRVSS